jgi:hypothetical protein
MLASTAGRLKAVLQEKLAAGESFDLRDLLGGVEPEQVDPETVIELIVTAFTTQQARGEQPNPHFWLLHYSEYRHQLRLRFEAMGILTPTHQGVEGPKPFSAENPEELRLLPALPPHEIVRELNRGGMGVVYEAIDLTLNRRVALKCIRAGFLATRVERLRFYREARLAASLHHPHLLPVWHYGMYHNEDALTMPLMNGGTLHDWFSHRRDVRESVALMHQVVQGVAYLHGRGFIHRDLKLVNVLMDEAGCPRVADFGLAWIYEGESLTLSGQHLGTPGYMAPEQTRGLRVDARADVWALGVMLYEALTGQRPFVGRTRDEVLQQTRLAEPLSPRRWRRAIPPSLERIILRCLEKRPGDRFANAAELQRELARWLQGDEVVAAPAPLRLPTWFGATASLLLATLTLGAMSVVAPQAIDATGEQAVAVALRRGQPVQLVGERGGPVSYRWGNALDRPALQIVPNKPLRVMAQEPTLLELLPKVPVPCYRVSVEIQTRVQVRNHIMGLYTSGSEHPGQWGVESDIVVLAFAHQETGQLEVRPSLYWVPPSNPNGATIYSGMGLQLCPLFSVPLRSLGAPVTLGHLLAAPGLWTPLVRGSRHFLEMEVYPEEVVFRFDGMPAGRWNRLSPVGQMIYKHHGQSIQQLAGAGRPVPRFDSQGALGIFLTAGTAQIRNLWVFPIIPNGQKDK